MTRDLAQFARLIAVIEDLAAGNLDARFPISPRHDDVDAVGFAVNTLVEELSATIEHLKYEAAARREKESELEQAERRQSKINEELQSLRMARLASIGALAAGVGHEINNPLTYVIGNLTFMQRQLDDVLPANSGPAASELRKLIRETGEGAERIRLIVQDLRLFARVDDEPLGNIDVCNVMESSLALAGNEIRHRARLERRYGDVPLIRASEPRLAQVFINLLINAAHSLPTGEASANVIQVTIRREGKDQLLIEIGDTGEGISESDLPRVFDPFFSTKPRGEGTGLGLPICRELISKMGGVISVTSELDVGTTFRIVMPIGDTEISEPVPPTLAESASSSRSPRVLIIDDDLLVAITLQRMLLGCEAKIATKASEALELLSGTDDFDLIFCDLMMPDMDGMDLFDAVKKTSPHLADRFVFITGGVFTERASHFVKTTSNRCIMKPFDFDVIIELIQSSVTD